MEGTSCQKALHYIWQAVGLVAFTLNICKLQESSNSPKLQESNDTGQQQSQPKYNQWFLRAPVELHRNQPAEDVNNQKTTFEMSHVK